MDGDQARDDAPAARQAWRGAGRLVRHETRILRNGFADAFAGWRDRLLIVILLLIGSLWLRHASLRAAPELDPRIVAGAAVLLSWLLVRTVRRRLVHLQTESLLAVDALDPVGGRIAGAVIAGVPAALMLGLAALLLPAAFAAIALGMGAGAIAAASVPLVQFGAVGRLVPARWGPLPGWTAATMSVAMALALVSALVARLALDHGGDAAAMVAASLAGLAALFWLIRPDDETARFLAMTGRGPWRSAALQLAPVTGYSLAAMAVTFALAGPRPAALAFLVSAGGVTVALMRSWLFRLHGQRLADTILSLAVVAVAVVTAMAPPLGLLFGLAMAIALYRRAASAAWLLD